MIAAGRAAESGAEVVLLEKTPRLGNKLRLTGKGRCNITNQTELDDFVAQFGDSGRFLYGAFSRFFVQDLLSFLHERGVATVVERGGRVFPSSNDARDVVSALDGFLHSTGVVVRLNSPVERLLADGGQIRGVQVRGRTVPGTCVIVAVGGASYPATGSTGDGYAWAEELGHVVSHIRPALIPLLTREPWVKDLQGLSLENVSATLFIDGKKKAEEFGDMLFTHFGLSGPIILKLSKRVVDALDSGRQATLSINLKPTLDAETLDQRLLTALQQHGRRSLASMLGDLLPHRLVSIFIQLLAVAAAKPAHQITSAERRRLLQLLQGLPLTIAGYRPLREAIVTAGGVATSELNPRTMESRRIKRLFFCGEVIDVDADTGGYNLQAAFSTGYLAGEAAARAYHEAV